MLLSNASENFNWSEISPTIFGAVFESTLNPETRRSGGMHYTSIENIHKVIDPLFYNALAAELDEITAIAVKKTRDTKLGDFQKKLAFIFTVSFHNQFSFRFVFGQQKSQGESLAQ